MRFSVYLNAQTPDRSKDLEVIEAVTAQAKLADDNGFVGVCLTEHHFTGYNTYGNPFMFGSYLAPQLQNLHVILSVAVPGLWNPLNFAESCNLLDMLTRGRCVIGVGVGGSPKEYEGLGRDTQQRGPLMDRVLDIAIAAMDRTDDDPPLDATTDYSSGTLTRRIMPGSFTEPRPRFARGALSDESIVDTARRGWALQTARAEAPEIGRRLALYRQTLGESGHDQATVDWAQEWSMVQKIVFVGQTDEQALEAIQAPLDYMDRETQRTFATAGGSQFTNTVVGVSASDRADFIDKAMIVGSADTVARQIAEYQDAGVDHLACVFLFGQIDPGEAEKSMRRFIDDVMPRFSGPAR